MVGRVLLCGLAAAAVLSACSPSRYDAKVEAAASDWKARLIQFITDTEAKAGTPGGEYAANKKFYEDVQSAIGGQLAQAKAAGDNPRAVEIMELLSKDVENLRKLHEGGGTAGLTEAVGEPVRASIETELRALAKLESELRSGNDNG